MPASPDEEPQPDPEESPEAAPGGKPLRPVDWDGAFSRTWAARDRDDVMNRLAAEQEAEWEDERRYRSVRELGEQLLAESLERGTGGSPAAQPAEPSRWQSGNDELQRKLDRLDPLARADTEDADRSGDRSDSDPR
ncbi:conserved hypothetical protein [Frankia canadensis]|uniref:Uncharacterized protein n=1 Tax=Frankia canadensis TaxID=1836972 RepID=A0A2I2KZA7_9ACTN|nr:hypothetical protein [Frankia canadensis]SNQ50989.1 conserved hypothetical protein [Frankia canadensis]SOU58279.1 conserved hypothetical protein [Frankia canadensis]